MPDRLTSFLFCASAALTGVAIGFPFTSTALAEEQTAALEAATAEPVIWIEAEDDAAEITPERAIRYCYAHGLEMHECRIVPAELVEWERKQ